jgi:SNF2 family DNA or RNA helicase
MQVSQHLNPAWKDAVYHEHQEHGIKWMLKAEELGYTIPDTDHVVRGGILGDKMGVGKTIQSLGLIANGCNGQKTLIVTPLAVRGQWESELRRADVNLFLPQQWGAKWVAQQPQIPGRKTVHLIHYDKLASKPDLCSQSEGYDRIILDEAHTIRNASTKKAEAVFKAVKGIKYRWALTGTPITNSMDDVTTYLKFIGCPTDPGKKWQAKYEVWARNLYLSRQLTECIAEGQENIVPPTPIEETRLLNFTSVDEEVLYKDIHNNEESKWRNARALKGSSYQLAMFAILLRLRQVSVNPQIYIKARQKEAFGWSGPEFNQISRKFDEVAYLLREATEQGGESHKWIIFCQFHEEMVQLDRFLKAHDFVGQVLQYHGGMNMREREQALKESKLPTEAGKQDVFLIQLKAGSTGLNLQHYDRMIFVSPWWTTAEIEQAKARAVRIGQKKVVKIYMLHLETEESFFNIDKFMMDKVFEKKELATCFEQWSAHLRPADLEEASNEI